MISGIMAENTSVSVSNKTIYSTLSGEYFPQPAALGNIPTLGKNTSIIAGYEIIVTYSSGSKKYYVIITLGVSICELAFYIHTCVYK